MTEPSKIAIFLVVVTAHLAVLAFALPRLDSELFSSKPATEDSSSAVAVTATAEPGKPAGDETLDAAPPASATPNKPAVIPASEQTITGSDADPAEESDDHGHDHDNNHSGDHTPQNFAAGELSDEASESIATAESDSEADSDPDSAAAPASESVAEAEQSETPRPSPLPTVNPAPAPSPALFPLSDSDDDDSAQPAATPTALTQAEPQSSAPRARPVTGTPAAKPAGSGRMKNLRPLRRGGN